MYLTKVNLDLSKRETNIAIFNREILHSMIENCFSGERQHSLWRLEKTMSGYSILMLSHSIPNLTSLENQVGQGDGKTVNYDSYLNRICENGRILNFRISVNPVVTRDGKRIPLNLRRTESYEYCAEDWFRSRMEMRGADILNVEFIDAGTIRIKNKGRLFKVTYQGTLRVVDANKMHELLEHGLGHGKAYGCGMLSVMP